MYVILSPIQIKRDYRDEFIEAIKEDARDSVAKEKGCLRFDVIQDASHMDRFWLYEVYKDEAAFKVHMETPHLKKLLPLLDMARDQGPSGAGRGSSNIWPPDDAWK
jgi:autoinducer 2-degrading protein